MANTYNPQRLRFVHDEKCYASFQEILDYVVTPEYYMAYRQTVYAEPMVFKYGDEKKPNIVLAIGSTNGEKNNFESNQIYFIDFTGLKDRVTDIEDFNANIDSRLKDTIDKLTKLHDACGVGDDFTYVPMTSDEILASATSLMDADKTLSEAIVTVRTVLNEKIDLFKEEYDEHVAKSKFNPKETQTIVWDVKEGTVKDGTVVTADLKVPDVMDLVRNDAKLPEEVENSLEVLNDGHSGHEGLFLNVTVTTVNEKATLWVNEKPYDISTNGKFIENAKYDYNTECIIFEYNNGDEPLILQVNELIDEWKVLKESEQYASGVVLKRERRTADPNLGDQYADILTAEIHVAADVLNMAEVINDTMNSRYGLFVSKQPIIDEQTRAEGAEKTLQTNIDNEKTRATQAEANLQTNIEAEQTRAEGAEQTLQDNIDAEAKTREEEDGKLDDKIADLNNRFINISGDKAIVVDENKKISLKIDNTGYDSTRILTQTDENGLKINFGLKYYQETNKQGGGETAYLAIVDDNDQVWGNPIDVTEFIMDGILNDVELLAGGILRFTFQLGNGGVDTVDVDLSDFIKPYSAGNGVELTKSRVDESNPDALETVINVKLHIDNESEFLSVNNNGLKLSGVRTAFENAVAEEKSRAEKAENGLEVSINELTATHNLDKEELEKAIAKAQTEATTSVLASDSDNTRDHLTVTSSKASDGSDKYTLELSDVASAKFLDETKGILDDEIKRSVKADEDLDMKVENYKTLLENEIEEAQKLATTTVVAGNASKDTVEHLTVTPDTNSNGANKFVVELYDIASQTDLDAEIERATNKETELATSIREERDRAIEAEQGLAKAIQDEQLRAEQSEHLLDDTLKNEIDRASREEARIEGKLNDELTRSKDVDTEHTNSIAANTEAINNEVARAKQAEAELTAALTKEETERQKAITNLESELTAADTAEKTAREAADVQLEIAYKEADTALKTALEQECAEANANTLNQSKEYTDNAIDHLNKDLTAAYKAADDVLNNSLSSAISDEADRAKAKELELEGKITDLTNTVGTGLDNRISEVGSTNTVKITSTSPSSTGRTITADVLISSGEGNIITAKGDGIYASATLAYDKTTNTLTFNNGSETVIHLTEHTLVQDCYFDGENIVLTISYVEDGKTTTKSINVPIGDLVKIKVSDVADDPIHLNVDGTNTLTAQLQISTKDSHNLIVKNGGIYASDRASDHSATYKGSETTVQSAISDIETRITTAETNIVNNNTTLSQSINNAKSDFEAQLNAAKNELNTSIGEAKTDLQGKIDNLNTTLTTSISSTRTELDGKITALDTKLTGTISTNKTELEGKITALDTKLTGAIKDTEDDLKNQIQIAKAELNNNINSAKEGLRNELTPTINAHSTDIAGLKSSLEYANGRIQSLETRVAQLENNNTILTGQVTSLLSDVATLKLEFEKLYNDGYVTGG